MNELTQFQAAAANIALQKLLYGLNFYISDFDAMAKLIGKDVGCRDYEALRGMHCMKWSEIPEPLRTQAREKIVELLGIQPPPIEADNPDTPPPQQGARGGLRLAFWK